MVNFEQIQYISEYVFGFFCIMFLKHVWCEKTTAVALFHELIKALVLDGLYVSC